MNWAKPTILCLNVCNFLHVNFIFKTCKYYMGEPQKQKLNTQKVTYYMIIFIQNTK